MIFSGQVLKRAGKDSLKFLNVNNEKLKIDERGKGYRLQVGSF